MQADSQPLEPVHPDLFEQWRNHLVTQHLYRDLETAYLDTAFDPLPITNLDKLAIEAIRRETVRAMTDLIMEWEPPGAETEEEDHVGNE